jgi:hypothetical protein
MRRTNTELLAIINYSPGLCLCGHGESCGVCSRSDKTREFEHIAKELAKRELKRRGVVLKVANRAHGYFSTEYML